MSSEPLVLTLRERIPIYEDSKDKKKVNKKSKVKATPKGKAKKDDDIDEELQPVKFNERTLGKISIDLLPLLLENTEISGWFPVKLDPLVLDEEALVSNRKTFEKKGTKDLTQEDLEFLKLLEQV